MKPKPKFEDGMKIILVSDFRFIGTGPLACLSLFPVADVDKVS